MGENLSEMVRKEFDRQSTSNYHPSQAAIDRLVAAMEQEGVEFGEIGVAAAVIGFLTAKGY